MLVTPSRPRVWLFVNSAFRLLSPWNSPGKNTGVGSHSLLQGIFPIQGLNLGLPHCRRLFFFFFTIWATRTCKRGHLFFPFSLHILWILLCFHSYFSHHVGVQTSISHTHQQLGLPKYPLIDSISGWAWPERWGHSCFMGSWGCHGCQDSQAIRTKECDERVGNLAPGVHGKYFFHGTYGTQPVGFSSYFSQSVFIYQVF